MNVTIPIFIILTNNTELNIYKNKLFINVFDEYLKVYSIYRNCTYIYAGNENEQIILSSNIENSYKCKTLDVISKENEFCAIYEYLNNCKEQYDWFINLELSQFSKDIFYKCISNINDNYDFMFFITYKKDISKYILDENDNRLTYYKEYNDNICKTIDTNIFVVKTSFFIDCCKKSNFDIYKFGELLWNGKYKTIEETGHYELNLCTKEQVDSFVYMVNLYTGLNKKF